MNVGNKILNYTKAIGLSAMIGLSSCQKQAPKTIQKAVSKPKVEKVVRNSTVELLRSFEVGSEESVRLAKSANGADIIKARDINAYNPNDSVGELYYKVYVGEADKQIRKEKGIKGNLVTVGEGITGEEYIKLANGKKAYANDYISKKVADSLLNNAIAQRDSALRANIAVNEYKKLKPYEKDAVISYMYNIGDKKLKEAKTGESFFEALSKGNMGYVQGKFSVVPSAQNAKSGIAKVNLAKMIIFGNGKIYNNAKAQKNLRQQIKNIAKNDSNAQQRISEAIEIAKKYGVSKKNLEITEKKIQQILNKFTNNN